MFVFLRPDTRNLTAIIFSITQRCDSRRPLIKITVYGVKNIFGKKDPCQTKSATTSRAGGMRMAPGRGLRQALLVVADFHI